MWLRQPVYPQAGYVSSWHQADVPSPHDDVRSAARSGNHLNLLSISADEPIRDIRPCSNFSVRVASSRARRFPLSRRRLGSDSKDIDCRKPWLGGQAVPQIDGEANIAGPQ